ncbi:uncharacterized protein [Dermacentor albipictus]|uniref:uncharacterized protein n=1 Tax=Dermacentor albipictus TaxID=60249 RepID=UPI0038FD3635
MLTNVCQEFKQIKKDAMIAYLKEIVETTNTASEVLITDRGTALTAELRQAILQYSQTIRRRTTAYHSQTNGLTERLNKTFGEVLAMYVDIEHKTWITSFKLAYGSNPMMTLDAMLPHVTDEENAHVAACLQRAEEARQLARLRIKDQQRTDRRHYNLRRRYVEYQPGDRVWV